MGVPIVVIVRTAAVETINGKNFDKFQGAGFTYLETCSAYLGTRLTFLDKRPPYLETRLPYHGTKPAYLDTSLAFLYTNSGFRPKNLKKGGFPPERSVKWRIISLVLMRNSSIGLKI
jgi:hypothetical protein